MHLSGVRLPARALAALGVSLSVVLLTSAAQATTAVEGGRAARGAALTASTQGSSLAPSSLGLVHPWLALNQVPEPTLDQVVAAAPHYDLVIVKKNQAALVQAMKAVNPGMTVLAYQNGAYAQHHEGSTFPASWYARDAGGNQITQSYFHNYLMDVSDVDWQNHVVDECRSLIAETGADGCYTDMLNTSPLFPGYSSAPPINPATGKPWTFGAYQAVVDALAARVRDEVPGPAAANGVSNGQRWYADGGTSSRLLADYTEAAHAETWLRDRFGSWDTWPSVAEWTSSVDMVRDAEAAGKTLMVQTKLWSSATPEQQTQWRRFSLASFLLATSGRSWYMFSSPQTFAGMATPDPEEQAAIGTPTDAYSPPPGRRVYTRDFSTGFVAVNVTDGDAAVTLPGGWWRDLDGNTVRGTVPIPGHTGMVWQAATTPGTAILLISASARETVRPVDLDGY
jgi:hypothetical protein